MRIIEYAEKPKRPVRPRIIRNTALASIAGLFAGIFLAFLRENIEEN